MSNIINKIDANNTALANFNNHLDALWADWKELGNDTVAAQEHSLSLTHGEGIACERFRWLNERIENTQMWDLEQRISSLDELLAKGKELLEELEGCNDITDTQSKVKLWNRIFSFINYASRDMDRTEDRLSNEILITDHEIDERPVRDISAWERGEALMYWLKSVAHKLTTGQLVQWSIKVNKRRKTEDKDYRLSFIHYTGCKIVIEKQLSKRYAKGSKAQRRAEESYARAMNNWEMYELGARLEGNHNCQFRDELIDPDASYYGRPGVVHSRYADVIDMRRISEDETVLQGYMLSCEAESYSLPKGVENVSLATVVIAMVRAEGNKIAACRMVDMCYSTFCELLRQARVILEEKLDKNEISYSEFVEFRKFL